MTTLCPSVKISDMPVSQAHGLYLALGYSEILSVYVRGKGHKGTCRLILGLSSVPPTPPPLSFFTHLFLKTVYRAL